MAMTLLKMCLFLLSMGGYVLLLKNRLHIRLEFAPALYCALISTALFCAGILNLMPVAVWLLFLGGLAALAVYAVKFLKERPSLPRRELVLYAGFLLVVFYFALLLYGIKVNEYDNFSHYATVVKDMLRSDSMPSFKSINIAFQSYPLGSSLFLYYTCRLVGLAESNALWANLLISLSGIFTLAAFVKKDNLGFIPFTAFAVYALIWRADFNSLLVDTILPVSAVAAFAILYYYRAERKKAALLTALMLAFVVNIKNSGIFFAAACLAYVWFWDGKASLRQRLFSAGTPAAACAAILLIWQRHTDLVFLDAENSAHAMRLRRLLWFFREKGVENMVQIAKDMVRYLFSPDNRFLLITGLITLCLIAAALPAKGSRKKFFWAGCFIWATALGYQLGLYAMYVFSMPIGEALVLAGYDRYAGSLLVFIFGAAAILTMDAFVPAPLPKGKRALACLALLLFFLPIVPYRSKLMTLYSHSYHQNLYEGSDRYLLNQAMERYDLPEGLRYIIYTENDRDYLYHLGRYDLWVESLVTCSTLEQDNWEELLAENDYIILLHNTAEARAILRQYGYDCPDDGLPAAVKLH